MSQIRRSRPIHDRLPLWWCCILAATLAVLSLFGTRASGEEVSEIDELSREIEQLEALTAELEAGYTSLAAPPEQQLLEEVFVDEVAPGGWFEPVRLGDFPGSILIPGSNVSVKIGGYMKGDFIHDFDAILDPDRFNVFTIPTDGRDGENTRLHARQTRLNLDARRPTPWGELRGFVEGDFFAFDRDEDLFLTVQRTDLRLRHAFGELAGWLVGQTWTTLTHIEALPETVDFESPDAFIVTRRAQIRWSHDLTPCLAIAVAIEDPGAVVADAAGLPLVTVVGRSREPSPDYVARIRYTGDNAELQFGGTVRQYAFQPDGGSINTEAGYSLIASGILNLTENQTFKFQTGFGEGGGGFRGIPDAVPNNSGGLDVLDIFAATAGYTIQWTDHWRSTAVYAYGQGTNTEFQEDDALRAVEYMAINLFWLPFDGTRLGVEYLYGTREDKDGSMGHANRFQLGVWYDLP